MTTTTASDYTAPLLGGRNHFLLRRLHSLTGVLFGGYLIVHLIVNATLVQAGLVYQQQVQKIHELPFLSAVEWLFIFLPIIYHCVYGVWITVTGQPNVNRYPYGKNWFYLLQRVTAVILIVFIAFHVLAMKTSLFGERFEFDWTRATGSVQRHFLQTWWVTWIIYPIGLLSACFHLANGFWAAAITWGVTVSAGAQRRWGLACIGLFVLTTALAATALVVGAR